MKSLKFKKNLSQPDIVTQANNLGMKKYIQAKRFYAMNSKLNEEQKEFVEREYKLIQEKQSNPAAQGSRQDCDVVYKFNSFYPQEMFIINLLSQFLPNNELSEVIKIISNVEDGAKVQSNDDGLSQTTTIKTGIVAIDKKPLPNPVTLKPRRTFPEVEQPESSYVLRMQTGASFALFEASGGFWRVECIHKIRDYLKEQLKDTDTIIIA